MMKAAVHQEMSQTQKSTPLSSPGLCGRKVSSSAPTIVRMVCTLLCIGEVSTFSNSSTPRNTLLAPLCFSTTLIASRAVRTENLGLAAAHFAKCSQVLPEVKGKKYLKNVNWRTGKTKRGKNTQSKISL